MSVGTFVQPDFAVQAPSAVKTSIQNCIQVHNRIAGSFAPHEQAPADMTIRIDAGSLMVLGNVSEVVGQNATITPTVTSGLQYQIARVLVHATTGLCSVVYGAANAVEGNAAKPAITTGCIPICQVLLTYGMTEITNLLITDERIMGGGSGGGGKEAIAVGGIYITTTENNPADDLGYGTWELFGSGKMLLGASADYLLGSFGGSKEINTGHSHTVNSHSHTISSVNTQLNGVTEQPGNVVQSPTGETSPGTDGAGGVQNIMNPYIVVKFWKRKP